MLIKCRFCHGEFHFKHFQQCPKCIKRLAGEIPKGKIINIKV